MPQSLADSFRHSPLIFTYKKISSLPDYLFWRLKGSPGPKVPHRVKERTVRQAGRDFGLRVLVETGTEYGQMINAVKGDFREIYSIELDQRLHALAKRAFAGQSHVHLLQGDSAVALPKLLEKITVPCLFWLDAHSNTSPLTRELEVILRHPVPGHVILIDDAHGFDGRMWSPTMDEIRQLVATLAPGREVEVRDNIIRIPRPRGTASSA